MIKKHFKIELFATKEDDEDFENFTKLYCVNAYVNDDVKARDHFHISEKCSGSAHRDGNINVKLNRKIPVLFHNLKNYDSHLITQELGKSNIKVNVCYMD